jgi:hypothetical protein
VRRDAEHVENRERIEGLVMRTYPDADSIVFSLPYGEASGLYIVAVFRVWEDERRRYGKQFVVDAAGLPAQMPPASPSERMVEDVEALAEKQPIEVTPEDLTGESFTVQSQSAESGEQLGLGVA